MRKHNSTGKSITQTFHVFLDAPSKELPPIRIFLQESSQDGEQAGNHFTGGKAERSTGIYPKKVGLAVGGTLRNVLLLFKV